MPTPPLSSLTDLSGKTAIVTGGARGIGLAIAHRLGEAGANLVIADIDGEAADLALQELKIAVAVRTDVSQEPDVLRMAEQAVRTFGSIDILINNAGLCTNITTLSMTVADFDQVIAVNLRSVFLCTRIVADRMIGAGRGGRIVNITSVDAIHPSAIGLAHYDAAKHGVLGFTKSVALELAPHRIWVNAIAPGITLPPDFDPAWLDDAPQSDQMAAMLLAHRDRIPAGRFGAPDDIARTALFLSSDLASYLTGSQVLVDGGSLLR
jgi:2-deoxy-D-gluconate 3-dehydrogenase